MKTKYIIVSHHEDPNLSTIEKKSEVKNNFTLQDITNHVSYLEKAKKEMLAKIELDKAQKTNIEEYYPEIKEIDPENLAKHKIYFETLNSIEQVEKKLDEVMEALKDYEEEVENIKSQINV